MTTANKSPLLEIRSLCAGYGPIEVLRDLSITVHEGEVVTLLGANGAGKSTTLRCVSGVHPLRTGSIWFDGRDVTTASAHARVRAGLAQVPEGRQIFARLTVHENVLLGAYTTEPRKHRQAEQRVYDLFPLLSQRAKQLGGTLSGGEQQMLAIGRALMSNPRLLLLDEPSMGIAPLLVEKIFQTLKRLNEEGLTIVLIEQNAQRALRLADRGYVLETGAITVHGPSHQLLADPRVRAAYLGS